MKYRINWFPNIVNLFCAIALIYCLISDYNPHTTSSILISLGLIVINLLAFFQGLVKEI